ncbi:hypothetical protein [Streptomyces sp. 3N207]|uniref:hypothetical protein n=1 Tax=Streptomyces sp. 3N207 TaxID=3457417 RepID=UPI003FD23B61
MNKPVWLWWSGTGGTAEDMDRCWQSFLRKFDIEHTFRLLKQTLGWTKPRLRDSSAADWWTWLLIAAHTQLRLVRPLVADLRWPWGGKPAPSNKLTPARSSGVQEPVREGAVTSACTKTFPARPRLPTRFEEPTSVTTPRRHDVGRILATGETYTRPTHHKKGTKPRRVMASTTSTG